MATADESDGSRNRHSLTESVVDNENDEWINVNVTENFKVVLLGDSQVGKTSLAHLCTRQRALHRTRSTIGFDPNEKRMIVNGKRVKLSIWDTAGEERYRQGGLIPIIYRGADAAVLMYDITCPKSFESIVEWLNELELHCRRESILVILVGNKLDREQHRKVETKSAEILAASRQMMFREVSSVDESRMEQVEDLFEEIASQLLTLSNRQRQAIGRTNTNECIRLGEERDGWFVVDDASRIPPFQVPPWKCLKC